jgi:dCMP deaminase
MLSAKLREEMGVLALLGDDYEWVVSSTGTRTCRYVQKGRPSKKDYYLNIAKAIAERSTCLHRRYGAVIVQNDIIVSTGYNGSCRVDYNCCDTGICQRGSEGCTYSVHAEVNAIISADPWKLRGAILYLTTLDPKDGGIEPCMACRGVIKNVGISEVVTE